MKKTILFALLAACSSQLKAQTIQQSVWGNKSYWSPYSKPKSSATLLKLDSLKPILNQPSLNSNMKTITELAIAAPIDYKMPIAKVSSTDRMPIVKTDEPGVHYDMLIKRLGTVRQDSVVKVIP